MKPTFLIIKLRDQKKNKWVVFFFIVNSFMSLFYLLCCFFFALPTIILVSGAKRKSWQLKYFWCLFDGNLIIFDKRRIKTFSKIPTHTFFFTKKDSPPKVWSFKVYLLSLFFHRDIVYFGLFWVFTTWSRFMKL